MTYKLKYKKEDNLQTLCDYPVSQFGKSDYCNHCPYKDLPQGVEEVLIWQCNYYYFKLIFNADVPWDWSN